MSDCKMCDESLGHSWALAEITRLSAELEAAKRDQAHAEAILEYQVRSEQNTPAWALFKRKAEAAERRCAEMGRAVADEKHRADNVTAQFLKQEQALIFRHSRARYLYESFAPLKDAIHAKLCERLGHDPLCLQLQAALAPAPQIAGEAKHEHDFCISERRCAEMGARLTLAERVIKAADAYDNFDCPHFAEDRCKCGLMQAQLAKEWNLAKIAYDKAPAPQIAGEAKHEHDFCITVWKPMPGTSPGFEQQTYCPNYRCVCGKLRFDEPPAPAPSAAEWKHDDSTDPGACEGCGSLNACQGECMDDEPAPVEKAGGEGA